MAWHLWKGVWQQPKRSLLFSRCCFLGYSCCIWLVMNWYSFVFGIVLWDAGVLTKLKSILLKLKRTLGWTCNCLGVRAQQLCQFYLLLCPALPGRHFRISPHCPALFSILFPPRVIMLFPAKKSLQTRSHKGTVSHACLAHKRMLWVWLSPGELHSPFGDQCEGSLSCYAGV